MPKITIRHNQFCVKPLFAISQYYLLSINRLIQGSARMGLNRSGQKYLNLMLLTFMLMTGSLFASDIYEAETANLSGVIVATNATGFSGSGFVDYLNSTDDYIEWDINISNAGLYKLTFQYALAVGNRPLAITVNGSPLSELDFMATGSFSAWQATEPLTIKLATGINHIRATAIGSSGANIDALLLTPCSKIEAEDANLSGVVIATNTSDFSGTGFADFINPVDDYIEWEIMLDREKMIDISFIYALAYGERPLAISIDGLPTAELNFPATGSFSIWDASTVISKSLTAGIHNIRATAIGASGPNIDYISVNGAVDGKEYEAEDAVIYGGIVAAQHSGFTGTGFVDFINPSDDYIEWTVDVNRTGTYSLSFRYALSYGDRPLAISVDNQTSWLMDFPASGSLITWIDTQADQLFLTAGIHTIRASAAGSSGANIDSLRLIYLENELSLTPEQQKQVERFLFPLPQECQITAQSTGFLAQSVNFYRDPSMSEQANIFLDDFTTQWAEQFNTNLPVSAEDKTLSVYVGTSSSYTPFQLAINQNKLNFARLSSVPNSAQAYSITIVDSDNELKVYIAATQAAGIYNGLTTFNQLKSALSSRDRIVIPHVTITDWPDIKSRGVWGKLGEGDEDELFLKYSAMKLNTYNGPFLYGSASAAGDISYPSKKSFIDKGTRHNIHVVPILVHLDYMLSPDYMVGRSFPEVGGIAGDVPFTTTHPWCFANPLSQQVLDGMLEAIARDVGCDYLWLWPSEHGDACYCSICNGDKRLQNIHEFEHIMHAYAKAKIINPNFQMTIITTQGTRDYNLELLDYITDGVGVDIYDGSLTYQTVIETPILDSFNALIEKMTTYNRSIGVVPMFSASHLPGNMLFPFNSPLLSQVRMQEFKSRNVERSIGWIPPNMFVQDINGQSMAEFAWNAQGRTPEEFILSWAVRKGMNNPELIEQVITLLDYPGRALSKAMRGDSMKYPIERMTSILMGKTPETSSYFDILKGFAEPTHAELIKVLQDCETALSIAEQQGDTSLILGARLMKQWIAIVERYSEFNEDPTSGDLVRSAIANLTNELSPLWESWIATQSLSATELADRREQFTIVLNLLRTVQ